MLPNLDMQPDLEEGPLEDLSTERGPTLQKIWEPFRLSIDRANKNIES